MKKPGSYLFLIFIMAFSLILLIAIAQVLAKRNISGLKDGNIDAAITFTINNRLQDVVNLSFDLEKKVIRTANSVSFAQSLKDSLTMLGYNTTVLDNINVSPNAAQNIEKLKRLMDAQVIASNRLLQFIQQKQSANAKNLADSMQKDHLSDSVFSTALRIKTDLETDLKNTLNKNTKVSSRLSTYNKVLAFIAIFAVLLLGTIIVNRHFKQVELIEALEKAKTAAQQSAQVKEQFMANMSHEIRTPLNAISGFSKILSQSSLNEEQLRHATIIKEATDNLIYIVNDILDLSRLEAGKLKVIEKEFSIIRLLQTVEEMFSAAAAEKNLQLSKFTSGSIAPVIIGDPDRVLQILVNLVGNAIKFTKRGYVKISVTNKSETENQILLEFKVEDSGIGIPLNEQSKIFDRFEQITPNNNENVVKGTGLGLSIVKNLVEVMDGSIAVFSEEDKGAVFVVNIPFFKSSSTFKPVNDDQMLAHNKSKYNDKSIMIVEDNTVNQQLLTHLLEGTGVHVTVANNGAEATDCFLKSDFDLIFLDIQMPVMNGYQFIKKLRDEINSTIPVIAMTAFATPGEKEKCLRAGMSNYISKPIQFSSLFAILNQYLNKPYSALPKTNGTVIISGNIPSFLLELAGGDESMARKVLKEIFTQIPINIETLQENRTTPIDFKRVQTQLHHMLSTYSPLGQDTTSVQLILNAQHISKQQDAKKLSQALKKLEDELKQLKLELESFA